MLIPRGLLADPAGTSRGEAGPGPSLPAAAEVDVLVVGSGVAGLSAALAVPAGRTVLLATKDRLGHSATRYAQGGIAAVLDPEGSGEPRGGAPVGREGSGEPRGGAPVGREGSGEPREGAPVGREGSGEPREGAPVGWAGDSVAEHVADTLAAGAGLCDPVAVELLAAEGAQAIAGLRARGVRFDQDPPAAGGPDGALARTREGGHSRSRVVHAGGDATGAELERALTEAVRATLSVRSVEHAFLVDLLTTDGRVTGALLWADGGPRVVHAGAVVLASGGAGQLFADTTNPPLSTGDGIAAALRAGAVLADMEFVQFHPTALHVDGDPRPLISEAMRGEGAVLRDGDGSPVMAGVHPLGDLAPRDVVTRAVAARMAATGARHLWLDATSIPADHLERRFPTILARCRAAGIDPSRQPIPVSPAAHYLMGGVVTDLDGRTTLPGLFAVGEAACTGVHGANRLASNSLLEGVVFAARIGHALAEDPDGTGPWPLGVGIGTARPAGAGAVDAGADGAGVGGSMAAGAGAGLVGRAGADGEGAVDNPAHRSSGLGYAPPPGDPPAVGPGGARPGGAGPGGAGADGARPGDAWPDGVRSGVGEPLWVRERVRRVMTDRVGVVRSGEGLAVAIAELERLRVDLGDPGPGGFETANLVQLGRAVAELAVRREESRGGHWRSDHPAPVEAWRVRQTLVRSPDGSLDTGLLAVPTAEEARR